MQPPTLYSPLPPSPSPLVQPAAPTALAHGMSLSAHSGSSFDISVQLPPNAYLASVAAAPFLLSSPNVAFMPVSSTIPGVGSPLSVNGAPPSTRSVWGMTSVDGEASISVLILSCDQLPTAANDSFEPAGSSTQPGVERFNGNESLSGDNWPR